MSSQNKPYIREVKAEDKLLRPQWLRDYGGQPHASENLKTYIAAARQRGEPLDHTLLYGPPGIGKTTLANIIANEMGTSCVVTAGPILTKPGDLANILVEAGPGDVIFIDEIHRMPAKVGEILYPAMEDFRLDIMVGAGQTATPINMTLNHFTLVGATTMAGKIEKPLRDRFGIKQHLDFYALDHLQNIVLRTSRVLGLTTDEDAALEIARRSRGTPRIANNLLRRVRDFAEVNTGGFVDVNIARYAFGVMGVDDLGLEVTDRKYLELVIFQFNCGPVGLNTIATALHEEPDVIAEMYEPYMLRLGLIDRSPQGRKATKAAVDHMARVYQDKEVGQ
jgi:Holliday junction DNA helicase RuvB